jgi:hypothetical protein
VAFWLGVTILLRLFSLFWSVSTALGVSSVCAISGKREGSCWARLPAYDQAHPAGVREPEAWIVQCESKSCSGQWVVGHVLESTWNSLAAPPGSAKADPLSL